MGLALRLFPITHLSQGIFGFSHTVLELTAYVRAMPSDGLIVLDWH